MWSELAAKVAPALIDILATAVVALVAYCVQFLRAQTHSVYAQSAFVRLNDATHAAVREIHQTLRDQVVAATADGKITAEEAHALREAAVRNVKAYLGKQGLDGLKRVVDPEAFEALIRAKVEAALVDLKARLPPTALLDTVRPSDEGS